MAIQFVSFQIPVTGEWAQGGSESWSRKKHYDEARIKVDAVDKGNSIHLTWTSDAPGTKGKPMRIRVPLTNIGHIIEDGDEKPEAKK